MQQWENMEAFMTAEAARDLEAGEEVRPCFAAFAGAAPLVLAFLRPFPQGRAADALIELLALAAPLDADRLALSIGGRAWSLDDPIPPVDPDFGDLRQRVVAIESVDGSVGRPRPASTIIPFDLVDGQVRWGEPLRGEGEHSWVASAFVVTIRKRRQLRGSMEEIRRQAKRCVALGHLLALSPTVADRLHLPA